MADCKLTKEIAEIIYIYLENGCTYETAAQAVGIHRNTIHNWIDRGEKGEPEYTDFVQNIKKVRAKAELKYLDIIEKAMGKDWSAARWKLSHMNPESWGEKTEQKIEHTGKLEQPVVFQFEHKNTVSSTVSSKATAHA